MVMTDQLSWEEARTSCLSLGGDLASVGSEEENNFIASLSSVELWLGGTDSAQEGTFVWSDGTAWTYQNWNSKEPNNLGNEDCVHMLHDKWNTNGKWNDRKCTHVTAFLCEKYL